MTLDQIDDAIRLRNYRHNVLGLARAAQTEYMKLSFSGCEHPDSHISLQVVRDAVIAECRRLQTEYEAKLAALGVVIAPLNCTCHPDDNPPVPCPQKYALTECREAAALTHPEGTGR